jgi:hypothetical protein
MKHLAILCSTMIFMAETRLLRVPFLANTSNLSIIVSPLSPANVTCKNAGFYPSATGDEMFFDTELPLIWRSDRKMAIVRKKRKAGIAGDQANVSVGKRLIVAR